MTGGGVGVFGGIGDKVAIDRLDAVGVAVVVLVLTRELPAVEVGEDLGIGHVGEGGQVVADFNIGRGAGDFIDEDMAGGVLGAAEGIGGGAHLKDTGGVEGAAGEEEEKKGVDGFVCHVRRSF